MNKQIRKIVATVVLGMTVVGSMVAAEKIDRFKVVTRHNPHVTKFDSLSSLTVGNGRFAFTVDATGLQTFPRDYSHGVPLGTMSEWGWHSFPNTEGFQAKDALANHDFHRGHPEFYSLQIKNPERTRRAVDYLRANPHRLHLGTIGLDISDASKISGIEQNLDLWTGKIDSKFEYGGMKYHVETVCAPDEDCIASNISSEGKATGKKAAGNIAVAFTFAYPSGGHCDDACKWDADANLHKTTLESGKNSAVITRKLDNTTYYIYVSWKGRADIRQTGQHKIVLKAKGGNLSFSATFRENPCASGKTGGTAKSSANNDFTSYAKASANHWSAYWNEGGFIDLGNVKDKRAAELERRIILSQYLMGAQEAGNIPPQETGLTYNSWFGKFHLEMTWWHLVHYGLWNKLELLDRQLAWYATAEEKARAIAQRQGFKGVRWMKMTDPSAEEAPSNVGSFLIWQQPHLTYMAELLYRAA